LSDEDKYFNSAAARVEQRAGRSIVELANSSAMSRSRHIQILRVGQRCRPIRVCLQRGCDMKSALALQVLNEDNNHVYSVHHECTGNANKRNKIGP